MTVVGVLFGFPTLVTAAWGSPMAFVFGFVFVVLVVIGLADVLAAAAAISEPPTGGVRRGRRLPTGRGRGFAPPTT